MHCIQTVIPTCVSKQGHKDENTTKKTKNGSAKHVDLWHDLSQTYVLMSPRTSLKFAQIIRPHQTCQAQGNLPKTPPTSPNSILPTPGGRKNGSHSANNCLREAVEFGGAFRSHGGRLTLRPRPKFRPPKTYIPSATSLQTDEWP